MGSMSIRDLMGPMSITGFLSAVRYCSCGGGGERERERFIGLTGMHDVVLFLWFQLFVICNGKL